ncbi:unnamed protein product, partial [Gulo gulo]
MFPFLLFNKHNVSSYNPAYSLYYRFCHPDLHDCLETAESQSPKPCL